MSYNVLLVDDDEDFRYEFAEHFDEYNIVHARDGVEALEILRKPHEIDLVLLDVRMPGPSGTEVLRQMKNLDPRLRVVILTGYSTKDVAVAALKGDADDYIEKPVNVERTRGIIERLLAKAEGHEEIQTADTVRRVKRVKQFLQRNYDRKVCLEDAARVVYFSPKYLSRAFKEVTGERFSDYRLRVKMEKAKKQLRKTGHTVAQIAIHLGYENPESFIRMFKKKTGLTPSEYRAKTSE
jgi:YesN/AraC family two-component response regulator